ncbi:PEP-CTERM sorting domain-containing protein, partial [Arsukibacterium sp. MJ3]
VNVPEPAMLGMFGLGLLGLRAFGRRRLTKK